MPFSQPTEFDRSGSGGPAESWHQAARGGNPI
jgi:hypothetical protein